METHVKGYLRKQAGSFLEAKRNVMAGEGSPALWSWGWSQETRNGRPGCSRTELVGPADPCPPAACLLRGQGPGSSCSDSPMSWSVEELFPRDHLWAPALAISLKESLIQGCRVVCRRDKQGGGDRCSSGLRGRSPLRAAWAPLAWGRSESHAVVPQNESSRAREADAFLLCAHTPRQRVALSGNQLFLGRKASGTLGQPQGQSAESTGWTPGMGPGTAGTMRAWECQDVENTCFSKQRESQRELPWLGALTPHLSLCPSRWFRRAWFRNIPAAFLYTYILFFIHLLNMHTLYSLCIYIYFCCCFIFLSRFHA